MKKNIALTAIAASVMMLITGCAFADEKTADSDKLHNGFGAVTLYPVPVNGVPGGVFENAHGDRYSISSVDKTSGYQGGLITDTVYAEPGKHIFTFKDLNGSYARVPLFIEAGYIYTLSGNGAAVYTDTGERVANIRDGMISAGGRSGYVQQNETSLRSLFYSEADPLTEASDIQKERIAELSNNFKNTCEGNKSAVYEQHILVRADRYNADNVLQLKCALSVRKDTGGLSLNPFAMAFNAIKSAGGGNPFFLDASHILFVKVKSQNAPGGGVGYQMWISNPNKSDMMKPEINKGIIWADGSIQNP